MASPNASSAWPVSLPIYCDSAGEVSGPVEMILMSHSGGGGAATAQFCLVVARLPPGDALVDRLQVHDERDGVKERQVCLACEPADRLRQRGRGERTGGDDYAVPLRRRQAGHLGALDADQGMR